jgi:hypothetical protein
MSKYNLTDILNEYIGGGRIGTLNISFKDLQDKMDDLENSDKVIVRTLSGPSGDGKVNREFEVVDRDSAVAGGGKQERGFTVYDYKFGFDPGSQDHFDQEYNFSVGGNDLKLAMELIDGVEPYRLEEEKSDKKELPQSIKDKEKIDAEIEAKKAKGMMDENRREKNPEGMGQLYVQPAVQKAVKFHLDAYDKGDIDVDDMIQAVEDIIFGYVKAPGMREQMYIDDEEFEMEMGRSKKDSLKKEMMIHIDQLIDGNIDMNDFMNVVEEIMAEVKAMNENGHVEDFADELVDEDTAMSGAVADELEAGAIGDRVEEIKEELAPTGIGISGDQIKDLIKLGAIAGVEVYVRDKDGKNVRKVDYTLTNTDFEKDPDDIDYIDENLKEHFKRFMFKKYK